MYDVAPVGVVQGDRDRAGNANDFRVVRQRTADHIGEAASIDVIQRAEETVALCVTNFNQPDYVRVVESGKSPCLLSKPVRDHLAELTITIDHVQTDEAASA